jgi:hypothetical protein
MSRMSQASHVRTLVCGLMLVLTGRPLVAQFPSEVAVGTRVRVAIPDSLPQAWGPRQQWLRGDVSALTADTLYLRMHGTAGVVPIRRDMVKRIDRSLGMPSRPASAIQGAVGGAFLGALYGVLLRTVEAEEWRDRSVGEAAGLGAGTGAGIGFVLGAIFPTERWRRLRLR